MGGVDRQRPGHQIDHGLQAGEVNDLRGAAADRRVDDRALVNVGSDAVRHRTHRRRAGQRQPVVALAAVELDEVGQRDQAIGIVDDQFVVARVSVDDQALQRHRKAERVRPADRRPIPSHHDVLRQRRVQGNRHHVPDAVLAMQRHYAGDRIQLIAVSLGNRQRQVTGSSNVPRLIFGLDVELVVGVVQRLGGDLPQAETVAGIAVRLVTPHHTPTDQRNTGRVQVSGKQAHHGIRLCGPVECRAVDGSDPITRRQRVAGHDQNRCVGRGRREIDLDQQVFRLRQIAGQIHRLHRHRMRTFRGKARRGHQRVEVDGDDHLEGRHRGDRDYRRHRTDAVDHLVAVLQQNRVARIAGDAELHHAISQRRRQVANRHVVELRPARVVHVHQVDRRTLRTGAVDRDVDRRQQFDVAGLVLDISGDRPIAVGQRLRGDLPQAQPVVRDAVTFVRTRVRLADLHPRTACVECEHPYMAVGLGHACKRRLLDARRAVQGARVAVRS